MNTLLLLALMFPAQSGTLDQSSPKNNAWFNAGAPSLTWQIEVATGVSGTLEGFTVEISGSTPGVPVDFDIITGAGWNTGTPVWSGTLTTVLGGNVWESFFVDVTSASISLNAGDLWVIQVNGSANGGIRGHYVAPPGTPPYPQPLYLNAPGCFADCGWRIGFDTYMLTGPSFTLAKTGTCSGPMTLSTSGGTPNTNVAYIYGNAGLKTKPSGVCAGTTVNIANPKKMAIVAGNGAGTSSFALNAPPVLCGQTIQAVLVGPGPCTVSNTIIL